MKEMKNFWGPFYGLDTLSVGIILISLLLELITFAYPKGSFLILGILGFLLLILVFVRMISKNHEQRIAENQAFLKLLRPLTNRMDRRQEENAQKKIFRFYDCPSCKQRIRVPRGQGRIEITCPQCGNTFIKKS